MNMTTWRRRRIESDSVRVPEPTERADVVITETSITSKYTRQSGVYVGDNLWVVSYLPGREFDLPGAITAISAAAVADSVLADSAAQLGLTAAELVGFIAMSGAFR
ncbi:hypothetical protein [Nocardia sp. NPDC060249]|uniref:hypothetical protein n=1 Tax=Nocardia sp. NPDC060249 TaxID=3347082 RepID=UPI0036586AFF